MYVAAAMTHTRKAFVMNGAYPVCFINLLRKKNEVGRCHSDVAIRSSHQRIHGSGSGCGFAMSLLRSRACGCWRPLVRCFVIPVSEIVQTDIRLSHAVLQC
jgi:hypothetical protein